MLETLEKVQEMSNKSIDATMKNFDALSKSAQTIATEMADYSKKSFDNGTKAMEKLFAVKSPDKVIEVQSEYAKSVFEGFTAQVTKLGELYADLAKVAFKPYEDTVAEKDDGKVRSHG